MHNQMQEHRWANEHDGKLTFWGIYNTYYDEVSKGWYAESTRNSNYSTYLNKILPNLPNHDRRAIDTYTHEDFLILLATLKKQGQGIPNEPHIPYDDATLKHYDFLVRRVMQVAANHYLCPELFLKNKRITKKVSSSKRHAVLPKSLSVQQEQLVSHILQNYKEPGAHMGLLLMYALGLRNAEACGANWGDLKPMENHPECIELWVYKTTAIGSNILRASGKTDNADRIIPIPSSVLQVLNRRKRFIMSTLPDPSIIDDLPIACREHDFTTRCSSRDLTDSARILFQEIELMHEQMYDLQEEIRTRQERVVSTFANNFESEPSAYIFRRNFGTHLHLLGLDESEISYIIGHDIESRYETRNEFMNEDKRYRIKLKMEQRPLVNLSKNTNRPNFINPGQKFQIESSQKLRIPTTARRIHIQVTANEPNDPIKIQYISKSESITISKTTAIAADQYHMKNRHIKIIKKYKDLYK